MNIYSDYDAISYIYDKFKPGILTAKYIPLILSIAGDSADNIVGIKGLGPAKTIKLIQNHNLPPTPWEIKQYDNIPDIISNNIDLIERNYRVISFEEQIKRTNMIFNHIEGN